jgi:hexosaminidase
VDAAEIALIPRPVSVVRTPGVLALGPDATMASAPGAAMLAEAFARGLADLFGPARPDGPRSVRIVPRTEPGHALGVRPDGIVVEAATPADAFHAAQTIRQLAPPATLVGTRHPVELPCCEIEDGPRFRWRGLMIDVCRHFFGVETLKRFVDLLALHKMNTLHLHLTEDQAWRVEVLRHPRLTEHGGWRTEPDGTRYGGFLTQSDLRHLVAYAADRFITVVPEIEMPGHAKAALSTYPDLSCAGGPFDVANAPGIYADIYCTKPEVFTFLEDVMGEVLDVFPSELVHVGGDEAPKKRWRACATCQETIRRERLADEHALQSFFIRHFDRYLQANGRRLVGWDEILEGGLAEGAAVMSWRGKGGGIAAGKAGHDVVMTPMDHCYFDWYQADPQQHPQPPALPMVRTLREVWDFDPVPEELEPHTQHVLGGQGNLWTEFIESPERLEQMAFPRLCALAEAVWSPRERGDWHEFSRRLDSHLERLDALGVNTFRGPRE